MSQEKRSKRDAKEIKKACPYFRVLIIGRANAGKTTILQKICSTTENPEVRDPRGRKIDISLLKPSNMRGMHDVEKELVFPKNPGFIFHDSRGFESGGSEELESVKKFIVKRSKEKKLKNRLHIICIYGSRYCIPTDNPRLLTAAETSFFDECGTGKVPVIAIFTKFDHGDITAFSALEGEGLDIDEAKRQAPSRSKADFEKMHLQRIYERTFPPRNHVYLRDMEKPESNCGDLVEQTADALNDDILRMLFVSSQRDNLGACIKYAITKGIVPYLLRFTNTMLMDADVQNLIYEVLVWFPKDARDLHAVGGYAVFGGWVLNLKQEKDTAIAALLSLAGPPPAIHQILKLALGILIITEYSYSLPQENRLPRSLAFYQASSALKTVNKAACEIDLEKSEDVLGSQLLRIVTDNLLSHN